MQNCHFYRTVVSLEEVSITSCQQVAAILAAIQEDTRGRELDLSNNNRLKLIEPGLLARVANLLEVVDIRDVPIKTDIG